MSERKQYIDIAKGLGIVLVILGHLDHPHQAQLSRHLIYAFHMPLFFMLSGMFANTQKPFAEVLKKSAKTVYLPYAVFVLFDILLTAILQAVTGKEPFPQFSQKLLTFLGIHLQVMNIALWFLFALFIIQIVYYLADKCKPIKYLLIIGAVAFVIFREKMSLPHYCVWLIAVPGFAFYALGHMCRKRLFALEEKVLRHRYTYAFIATLLFVGLLFSAGSHVCVDTTLYRYGNPFLYFINAVVGVVATLMVSVLLSDVSKLSDALGFYGKNSIVILVSHYYLCRPLLRTVATALGFGQYLYSAWVQIVMLLFVLIISVPLVWFVNRYAYFIFGKKKSK